MIHTVLVGDGRIVVPQVTYDCYLRGIHNAALVEREGQAYLMPLLGPAAGGMLLKQRNPQGDRVLLAMDFLAARGCGPFSAERQLHVRWDADVSALLIEGLGTTTQHSDA